MIRLTAGVRDLMVSNLAARLPNEGCGLLIGTQAREATAWAFCRNIHEEPTRHFRMHPDDLRVGVEWAARLNAEVLASVHSHPTVGAHPSPGDIAAPLPPGWDLMIVSFAQAPDRVSLRAWEINHGSIVEALIVPE